VGGTKTTVERSVGGGGEGCMTNESLMVIVAPQKNYFKRMKDHRCFRRKLLREKSRNYKATAS